MIDIDELEKYAWRVRICNSYKMANRIHGYQGRIELFQATDEAVKVLQRYGLERHGISRLEVARDRMFNNSLVTAKYRQIFQDSHYLKWGKGAFLIGTSRYFGKEMSKRRGMYMLCDLPPRGKFGNTDIVHVEFVLLGKGSVKKKLNVETIYDLGSAEDYFKVLAEKYLVKATVNDKRVQKHWPDSDVCNIGELIELVTNGKERISDTKQKHKVMNWLCDAKMRRKFGVKKKHVMCKRDKLISNQGLGYWVKKQSILL